MFRSSGVSCAHPRPLPAVHTSKIRLTRENKFGFSLCLALKFCGGVGKLRAVQGSVVLDCNVCHICWREKP
jgi:hypothetical protein